MLFRSKNWQSVIISVLKLPINMHLTHSRTLRCFDKKRNKMKNIDDFENYDVMHQLIQATCAELMKKGNKNEG